MIMIKGIYLSGSYVLGLNIYNLDHGHDTESLLSDAFAHIAWLFFAKELGPGRKWTTDARHRDWSDGILRAKTRVPCDPAQKRRKTQARNVLRWTFQRRTKKGQANESLGLENAKGEDVPRTESLSNPLSSSASNLEGVQHPFRGPKANFARTYARTHYIAHKTGPQKTHVQSPKRDRL